MPWVCCVNVSTRGKPTCCPIRHNILLHASLMCKSSSNLTPRHYFFPRSVKPATRQKLLSLSIAHYLACQSSMSLALLGSLDLQLPPISNTSRMWQCPLYWRTPTFNFWVKDSAIFRATPWRLLCPHLCNSQILEFEHFGGLQCTLFEACIAVVEV